MTEASPGPRVGVVGGSRSDFPVLEAAVAVLDELGVPSELTVVSAHRTPDRLFRYAEEAADRGIRVIVAGAGGAAHLPGMLAAKSALPVIGVPIPTEHRVASICSCRSSRCHAACRSRRSRSERDERGLLAAAILALSDLALAERLAAWRARQTQASSTIPRTWARPEAGAQPGLTQGVTAPRMPTSIDHRVEVAVMNMRRPSGPPKVQLAASSGSRIRPSSTAAAS